MHDALVHHFLKFLLELTNVFKVINPYDGLITDELLWFFDKLRDVSLMVALDDTIGLWVVDFFSPNDTVGLLIKGKSCSNERVGISHHRGATQGWLGAHDRVTCSFGLQLTVYTPLCAQSLCQLNEFLRHIWAKKSRIPQNKSNLLDGFVQNPGDIGYKAMDNRLACYRD